MKKPWHLLRKIYVPIIGRITAKRIIRKAERFANCYEDKLSLEVLKLRERYVLDSYSYGCLHDASLFLDFLIRKKYDICFCKEGFSEEKRFDFILILYDKGNAFLDYTWKLLRAGGYGKGKIRAVKCSRNADLIELKENEGIMALTSKERKEYFVKAYGKSRIWNCVRDRGLGRLIGVVGMQYMDVFEPMENEIIVNAGAYDGRLNLDFLMWGGNRVKKIYAFEADPFNAEKCEEFIRDNCDGRVILIPKGCWNEITRLAINSEAGTAGSRLGESGEYTVDVTTIDSVVNNERVTYIKMDIEGAELNALKGAKNTIIKNRPRLAVCVYHKCEDIYEIPQYILSLVPEYRFYLRHYSTIEWETVLYAYCP